MPMLLSSRSSSSFILRTGFVAISTLAFQSLWQQAQQQRSISAEAFPLFPSNTSCRAVNINNNQQQQQHRFMSSSSSSSAPSTSSSSAAVASGVVGIDYPELVVFDLDACLWDQEMFEMSALPDRTETGDLNGLGQGVTGAYSGYNKISLHPGSLIALQEHAQNTYPGMKVCFASSADTPFAEKVGRATLKLLEVVPGMTVWDLVMRDWDNQDINQIGRQPPLSR